MTLAAVSSAVVTLTAVTLAAVTLAAVTLAAVTLAAGIEKVYSFKTCFKVSTLSAEAGWSNYYQNFLQKFWFEGGGGALPEYPSREG